ncbi:MAG: two-component regulator propeller domain-containing protein [Anaerolineales bacterium]
MKQLIPVSLIILLLFTSLACNLGAAPDSAPASPPTPVETDASNTLEPDAPIEPAVTEEPSAPNRPQESGLTPGWYPYTNANVARDLVVYKDVVHAATLGGLITWRLDSGYSMRYTPLDGMGHVSANSIATCEIPEPRILVGTLSGISVYDPNTGLWTNDLTFPADSRVNESKINRIVCDQANNRLLVGYSGLGILDLATGDFQRFTRNEGLTWDGISDFVVVGKDIWIATGYNGINKISNGQVTVYNKDNGLPDERVHAVALAPDGTLWFGASSGLMSFKANQWTLFGSDSDAKLSDINEIRIAPSGKIWVVTAPLGTGRLCQFNPQTATCDVDEPDLDNQAILALTLDENGNPIYGTSRGVHIYQNGGLKSFKTEDGLASNFVDFFASAPDGSLWVGTDGGINILDPANPDGNWQTFRKSDIEGMGGSWAAGIAFAPDGSAWVGVVNGDASRYQSGDWSSFDQVYSYQSVTVDDQNRAWFGHPRNGIIVLNPDGSTALTLTSAEGLPSDSVHALLSDLSGRVWIGTDKGLAKYENESLEVVFGPDDKTIPNVYIRALALDADGSLIIGTFTGLARYDGRTVEILLDFLKDGFNQARLTTLAVAPDGQIWVGSDKGLLTSNDSNWNLLTTANGLPSNYISALHIDQYGAIWVGGGGSNFDGGGILQIVP